MASRAPLKTTFEPARVLRPIFTGGAVALDNGARILASTLGEDAVLTDPRNGQHLAQIEGDGELISNLTLTPQGSHLIICSRSLSMRIYALRYAQDSQSVHATLMRSLKPHGTPVAVLAVDRTGTLLATGGTDGAIKVWDIAGGFVTHTFRGPSVLVSALHFFELTGTSADQTKKPKGKRHDSASNSQVEEDASDPSTVFRLASGSQDGKVRVWDLHKRSCVANLDTHVSEIRGLGYSPAQHTLVTASRDKTLVWWDVKTWKIRKVVPCLEQLEAAGFVGDGRITYSAGSNGCLRLWDTDTGREMTVPQGAKSEEEAFVSAIHRGELPFILCVQSDHTLVLFALPDTNSAISSKVPAPEPLRRITGTHDDIIDLCYATLDHSLLALATNSEDVRLVSATDAGDDSIHDTWAPDRPLYFGQDVALLRGHEEIVIALDVDWSGHWIVTGAKDNTARLWRIDPVNDSYTCWATFSGHAESVGAVALPRAAPAESTPARQNPLDHPPAFVLTGSQDLTVKRWEVPRKAQTAEVKSATRSLYTRKAHDKDINAIDVHHSDELFASASQDKTVKIVSVDGGEVQGILRGHKRGVWSVQFSPAHLSGLQGGDGPLTGKGAILTGSGDKTVKLWSLADYTCVRTFEGHSNSVLKVVWLNPPPKGESSKRPILFASAGGDGLVKVWNANSGETECTLDNHEDRVWALAVHHETNAIVSGSGDSTLTLWKDTTVETQEAASQAALQLVEQEQELQNHIFSGSYREAITLALQLNHPGRLLSLFTSVVKSRDAEKGSLCGLHAVDQVLATLSDEQIFLLLLRLRDWNTNARTAPVAQRILSTIVRSYPASKLSGLSVKGAKGQRSLKEVLDALRVYTERHYKRMEELKDESYLVEYTLLEMDSLAPVAVEEDEMMHHGRAGGLDEVMAG